jgi:hypothetical protein
MKCRDLDASHICQCDMSSLGAIHLQKKSNAIKILPETMEKNEFQGRILKEKCINPTTFFYLCETRKNKEEERKDIQQNATYEK